MSGVRPKLIGDYRPEKYQGNRPCWNDSPFVDLEAAYTGTMLAGTEFERLHACYGNFLTDRVRRHR